MGVLSWWWVSGDMLGYVCDWKLMLELLGMVGGFVTIRASDAVFLIIWNSFGFTKSIP
jgi:hypothetical protein